MGEKIDKKQRYRPSPVLLVLLLLVLAGVGVVVGYGLSIDHSEHHQEQTVYCQHFGTNDPSC